MLRGATMAEPDVVQVDWSTSMMKASLYWLPTYSEYSSERNRKSTPVRQLTYEGRLTSTLRMVTSKSVLPRTVGPLRSAPVLPEVFGCSAKPALPLLRIANWSP